MNDSNGTTTRVADPCYRTPNDTRAIRHRHTIEHTHVTDCDGCEPCPETHCPACGKTHGTTVCPTCLGKIRDDLRDIVALHRNLRAHAYMLSTRGEREGGPPLGGQPMVLLGPVSVWADDDAAPVPTVALVWWEYAMRQSLGQPTMLKPTLARAVDYIAAHLTEVALAGKINLALMRKQVKSIRVQMEDMLSAGLRDEHGVPCVRCGNTLVRECHENTGLADEWTCRGCHAVLKAAEYWMAVKDDYRRHAPALTAADLAEKLGIKANLIRVWGSRGIVRKRGRDHEGHTLYDVADVESRALGAP